MTVRDIESPPAEARDASSVGGRPRRPRLLWCIVALQMLLMICMTVLYPAFQNADEGAHIDYILAHRQGQWWDGPGQRPYQIGVSKAIILVPGTQFRAHVGAPVPLRSSRKSFDQLGTARSTFPVTDQMVQHPPLYYGLAAGFSFLIPHFSKLSFDWQVFWLRSLSTLLLIPIPLLIYSAARRMTRNVDLSLLAAAFPIAFPGYLRTGGSVTNDALLVLATTVLLALLVRVLCGDLSRRTAVLVGVAWTVGLLTKGFALALPPVIVLAYLVGARAPSDATTGLGARVRRALPPILTAGVIGAVAGGWWWVRNVIVYHAVQPNGLGPLDDATRQYVTGPDRPGGTDLAFFGRFFQLLGQRTFGSLGLMDTPSLSHPPLQAMAVVLLALLAIGTLLGTRRLRTRPLRGFLAEWTVGRALVLLLPTALTIALLYLGARTVYLRGRQLPGIQIRYLFIGVLGVAIVAAVAVFWVGRRWARWILPGYFVATFIFLALSVNQVLNVEMSPPNVPTYTGRIRAAVHFVVGWAPWPSPFSLVLGGLTALAAAATLVGAFARAARRNVTA